VIAQVVRSSAVEAVHEGAIAVANAGGTLLTKQGDVDRIYFMRSVAKPFQASVAQELGAALPPEWLAVACSSHGASPAQVAIVLAMLADAGLGPTDLGCPPAWPLSEVARSRAWARGHRAPTSIWHNCSGKHAAMLRACVVQGWETATYLSPTHPLQQAIRDRLSDVTGQNLGVPGVDGCGAPVWMASTSGLATAYARLGTDDQLRPIWTAMHRFAALTADHPACPVALSRWTETAAKLGAEGLLGIASRRGFGIVIKAWDGSVRPLGPVAAAALGQLGLVADGTVGWLETELEVPVLGGGDQVGRITATVELS